MIKSIAKEMKQRRSAINKQIKSLQKEAKKLDKALRILKKLGLDVLMGKGPALKAKKRTMSAAGRRAVGAAAKARWAKLRAQKKAKASPAPAKQRKMSAAGREAISLAAKARWAKIKAEKAKK